MGITSNLILFLILFLIFLLIMKVEPRSLFSGGFLALSGLALFFLLQKLIDAVPIKDSTNEVLAFLVHIIGRLLQLVLAAGPVILALFPITLGILLIKQEGFKFGNVASIFFGALTFTYVVLWPLVGGFKIHSPATYVYAFVTVLMVYFIMLKTVFTASSIVNQIHRRGNKGYEYILVLGTDLEFTKTDILMQKKVDKALELYRENPGSRLIFSGGNDFDGRAEADVMADYARESGVPDTDVIVEDKSIGAEENIKASYALMDVAEGKKRPKFTIVSGAHHVLRPLLLARINKIKCNGYGAAVKLHYRMNAFAIEYISYLKRTKYRHIIALGIFMGLIAVLLTVVLKYAPKDL